MGASEWLDVPVGIDAHRWVTRRDCRTVLAVVHTVTSGERVLEAVELLENDHRVQVVFTRAPDVFGNGVEDLLRATGGVVLPWEQAVREEFDLALAASFGSLHQVHAPVVVMPHGAGYAKGHRSATGRLHPYGLDSQRLLHNGRPTARVVVLSHENQLDVLREQCPEALGVAEVIGDLCYDRLVASLPARAAYREALGVAPEQELVVVTSTWGTGSLFGMHLDLVARLLDELPADRFQLAALAHPGVWFSHGPRQVRAWLADCVDAGLRLFTPELDWRAALVAADHVVGDHGSTTAYAAAIGKPVLLVESPARLAIAGNAPQARLRELAPTLRTDLPLAGQLTGRFDITGELAGTVTSRPGRAAGSLRQSCYRLLGLTEPGAHRALTAVPVPQNWCRS
ncbi:hypothetical protein [Lentzea cavernae]|uniref:UDP-N-acetylglucosamine:LPS N-acetylglucosamine transferase n=1 Tax=Lentzea cavernae TaxID=2020703 RepID=A0ABQ3MIH2_9PSEU|nr:hypothetical protein [Lentzea cavernae]GHH48016.1 hypothetical protein GCM10017774_53270 [Lentzea cavernae]